MRMQTTHWIGILALLTGLTGCTGRESVSTTTGNITVECDEAIFPVMQKQGADFERTYREAKIILRSAAARSATVDFINDSTELIAIARPFNSEELQVLASSRIEYQGYPVALDAVAVILHKDQPLKRLRVSQLDSILSGATNRWPAKNGHWDPIEVVLNSVNSSTNEIVRSTILGNKPFTPAATYFESSPDLVRFVQEHKNAIGIVGLSWLQDLEGTITVASLGDPNARADSTQPGGQFYSPAQANVYRGYYPLSTKVFMYNRQVLRTVGLGFIAYVGSAPGQKIFQSSGLVPATMPVRLVETTSKQVK
jgi:phosphate transport system substrate-binding protein